MVALYLAFLALVALERLVELLISRRNAAWARERGAIEYGQGHFRAMAALHTSFFAACALEVLYFDRPYLPWLGLPMIALAAGAQGLRYWAILSLGRRWNVRVIVIPGMPLVRSGPYRFLRHPNYVAVAVEIVAIPLVHTAIATAVVFGALNLALLRIRIRCEEPALAAHSERRAAAT